MKLLTVDRFLTIGAGTLPGGFRAVAIHPSSEVDLVDLGGGVQLTVGSVVPVPGQAQAIAPVRYFLSNGVGQHAPLDGDNTTVGEKLVLALYEGCDPLVPLGPRVPVFRSWRVKLADLPALAADAKMVFRVPMHGRSRCVISISRSDPLDLGLIVLGRRAGTRESRKNPPLTGFEVVAAAAVETWFDGGGAPPSAVGVTLDRQYNVENERFDELNVYVYGALGTDDNPISAEGFGEGGNL
jgi:hypothetical protein